MFSNLKISFKIAFGFAIILIISIIIVLIAMFNMLDIQNQSNELSKAYIPEVEMANSIEGNAQFLLLSVRGYTLSEDDTYYNESKEYLKNLKSDINVTFEHVNKFPQLDILKQKAIELENQTSTYENLLIETHKKISGQEKNINKMMVATDEFLNNCTKYLESQNKKIKCQITDGVSEEELNDRIDKINSINKIIYAGNTIRINNIKSQALNDIQLLENALKDFEDIEDMIESIKNKTIETANINQLNHIKESMEDYKHAMESYLSNWQELNNLKKMREEIGIKVLKSAQDIAIAGISQTKEVSENTDSSISVSITVLITGLTFAVLFGILISYIIIRGITKPVNRIIKDLNQSSDNVAIASGQLSSSSQQLAEGSSEQASALEQTSATLNESASMIQQTTENTNLASVLSKKTKDSAVSGNIQMKDMMQSMGEIKKSSDEISKIIKVIDDIAFQTNILSLNAAVEAARAGEAGAGFAVVAEEVRNLAQRSAKAAKDTAEIIEKNIQLSDRGVSVAEKVGNSLLEINEHATKVNSLIDDINAASNEQAMGINQINTAVSQMEQVTQQNAANAEESASASEELNAQAESLKEIVEQLNRLVTGKDKMSEGINSYKKSQNLYYSHNNVNISNKKYNANTGNSYVKKTNQNNTTKIVNPEEVIPLDDDIADF